MQDTHIPLSRAAFQLGLSYNQALRRLLTGRLDGDNRNGKWLVTVESVQRAKREAARITGQVA